jgi:hypothetical protein
MTKSGKSDQSESGKSDQSETTQKTPKNYKIPIPKRGDFFQVLANATKKKSRRHSGAKK